VLQDALTCLRAIYCEEKRTALKISLETFEEKFPKEPVPSTSIVIEISSLLILLQLNVFLLKETYFYSRNTTYNKEGTASIKVNNDRNICFPV
jgi:hypothetical protein